MLSHDRVFATLWTVACQAPLSIEISRQEHWSRLLFPSPEGLPNPGTEPKSPSTPAMADKYFTAAPSAKPNL